MDDKNWLGAKLRKERLRMNLTQLELATKLNYESMQFVSLFERGLSKVPMQKLGEMAVILRFDVKPIIKRLVKEHERAITQEIAGGCAKALHK